ncbi:MAG: hypothetical protein QQN46_09535 [Nitrosopumilus sp.]
MSYENFDEEGLLKVIKATKLTGDVLTLTWNWDNFSDPLKETHELMDKVQKLFLEIFEYEQRMGSDVCKYQIDKINNVIVELRKGISYMENKIKPTESLEKIVD